MHIQLAGSRPTRRAPADSFVGTVWQDPIIASEAPARLAANRVSFEPGARTNWHLHSGPQWLLITDGRIRIQKWGEAPEDVSAGDAVMIAPGEKHWHGAAPGERGVHLAVNVDVMTEWFESVSDEDYGR